MNFSKKNHKHQLGNKIMSKKLLFLAFISILMISCSSDDDDQPGVFSGNVSASDIEGVWNVTEFYTDNGEVKTKVSGLNVTADFKSKGSNFTNAKVIFGGTPNVVSSTGTFNSTTTVKYLTFSQTEESTESVDLFGNWTINNNIVTISSGTISVAYTIVDFTGNTLKLKYDYDENVEVISGYEGQAKATVNITVTK